MDNFERKHDHDHDHHDHHREEKDGSHHPEAGHLDEKKEERHPKEKAGGEKKTPLLHDTEGFRCLETSMKILLHNITGIGAKFAPAIDAQLLQVVQQSLHHTNRYVRETGYFVCKELFTNASPEGLESLVGPRLGPELASGLDDNWSEVRFAASGALRVLFVRGPHFKSTFYEALMPRMVRDCCFFFFLLSCSLTHWCCSC